MRRSTVGILQLSPHSREMCSHSQLKQHSENSLLAGPPASQPPMQPGTDFQHGGRRKIPLFAAPIVDMVKFRKSVPVLFEYMYGCTAYRSRILQYYSCRSSRSGSAASVKSVGESIDRQNTSASILTWDRTCLGFLNILSHRRQQATQPQAHMHSMHAAARSTRLHQYSTVLTWDRAGLV